MKTKLAALALAASSTAGVGAALAPTASASTSPYIHYSANYSSASQCNYYRSGASSNISNHGGTITSPASSCHRSGGHYTYDNIVYLASRPIISGDRIFVGG